MRDTVSEVRTHKAFSSAAPERRWSAPRPTRRLRSSSVSFPTLTIAVPNFQGGRFLCHTLESLGRNRPHVRWRLQDAGSSDDSLSIARRLAGPHDVIVSEADRGQADGINRAFEAMGGDIIGFLNSDDELADGAAQAVAEFFATHPEIDLVYGEVEWIDQTGAATGRHAGRIETVAEILDIYTVWWGGRQWVQPEVFFRRSLWERVGPFDTRYNLAFDYDYWVRCFLAGARVARVPRVLARFRFHAAQKSRAARHAASEIRAIAERHLANAPIPGGLSRRLRAQIDYERYHLSEGAYAKDKPSFIRYLMAHPRTLGLGAIRQRLNRSWQSRIRALLDA